MTPDCDARIRPFPADTEVRCEKTGEHIDHAGDLRGYAYRTTITWSESDRRTFHGEWPGQCPSPGCVLPTGHGGRHAT